MENKGKTIIKGVVTLIAGIFLGWLLFGGSSPEAPKDEHAGHDHEKKVVWTCSMHPQIRQDKPGSCPICGMDLIPADDGGDTKHFDPNAIEMTESAMKLADIQTTIVQKQNPEKEIRLLGKVKPDERRMFSQTVHISGRIEKLYINYTGEKVYKGQKLASVYSPQLISAQKELFEMLNTPNANPKLVDAARNKLKLWKFTDQQIKELESKGELQTEIDILSDHTGVVYKRNVSLGDHVMEGQSLFHIVDLNNVWVMLEAYETDLSWIKKGDEVNIELEAFPGKYHKVKIDYIDPFIDPKTRIASIRVNLDNTQGKIKPEMFANAIIKAKLPVDEPSILIPKSAVLWTGKRAIIYKKVQNTTGSVFIMKEIILGLSTGDSYLVEKGIDEGDEIVINGVFKIDAAAQLAGKKSMMNPTGGESNTGHNHEDNANTGINSEKGSKIDQSKIPVTFKKQLGEVINKYLSLKDKLSSDNASIQPDIKAIQNALKEVNMKLVKGDAHQVWMTTLNSLNKELDLLSKEASISEQRDVFLRISSLLSDATINLGIETANNMAIYLQFCPMADNNNGGYWLSADEQIKNPYFGKKMLKCGETKETLTK